MTDKQSTQDYTAFTCSVCGETLRDARSTRFHRCEPRLAKRITELEAQVKALQAQLNPPAPEEKPLLQKRVKILATHYPYVQSDFIGLEGLAVTWFDQSPLGEYQVVCDTGKRIMTGQFWESELQAVTDER